MSLRSVWRRSAFHLQKGWVTVLDNCLYVSTYFYEKMSGFLYYYHAGSCILASTMVESSTMDVMCILPILTSKYNDVFPWIPGNVLLCLSRQIGHGLIKKTCEGRWQFRFIYLPLCIGGHSTRYKHAHLKTPLTSHISKRLFWWLSLQTQFYSEDCQCIIKSFQDFWITFQPSLMLLF